jgi:hypothetical protein
MFITPIIVDSVSAAPSWAMVSPYRRHNLLPKGSPFFNKTGSQLRAEYTKSNLLQFYIITSLYIKQGLWINKPHPESIARNPYD